MPHIQAAPFSHMPLLVRGYAQLGDPEIRRITAFSGISTVMPPSSTRKYTSLFVFLMNNGILPSGWLLSPSILTPFK